MQCKLTQIPRFRITNALGKYPSVPLSGKKLKRLDFQYIIDQVSTKLSSWKINSVSLAGRITLTKSII